jgi:hypothetical protein
MQVIGSVFKNPQILDFTDKYTVVDEDFADEFHKIAFGAIYKIHELGADKITLENISDFLSTRPKSAAIFKHQKGEEWLLKVAETSIYSAFDYYYNRLKKFSLLRAYDNCGIDISDIYDPDNIYGTEAYVPEKEAIESYADYFETTPTTESSDWADDDWDSDSSDDDTEWAWEDDNDDLYDAEPICGVCNGDGDCNTCGGDGLLHSSASDEEDRNCYSCSGSGNCRSCGGDGRL